MKHWIICCTLLLMLVGVGRGQTVIAPMRVPVSYTKTTSLIFSYPIVSVDIGSPTVIAKVPKRTTNILELKAVGHASPETNASVVTADGHFFAFTLQYSSGTDSMVIRFASPKDTTSAPGGFVRFPSAAGNKALLDHQAAELQSHPSTYGLHVQQSLASLRIRHIAIDSSLLWFELVFSNQSRVALPLDELTFSIETKRRSRRTAAQSQDLTPVYTTKLAAVGYHTPQSVVLAFHPFTVSKNQWLLIRARERKGSRVLALKVSGRALLKAKWMSV
jgi:conjugative transposon TraN protein